MKKRHLVFNFICVVLLVALFAEQSALVFATSLSDTITDLEQQQKDTKEALDKLKEEQDEVQDNVDELKSQSKDLNNMYNTYSEQMDSINEEIEGVQASMEETSGEIVSLNEELRLVEEQQQQEYVTLKKCLQASYENGGRNALILMLYSSTSMQDFLTKAEYVTALLEYERDLIAQYQTTQAELQAKAQELDDKQLELDAYQTELDGKQDELADLANDVKNQLSDTNDELADEQDKLSDYNDKIKELDQKMKNLESAQAAAQAQLAQQMAAQLDGNEDLSGSYAASASELEWLAATIQAEADGESYTGKLAVGSVIMNRVKSSKFPNTIVGVITQTNQFASYRSGKVELIISKGPNSTCMQAAQEVLNGARVGEYLFFMTQYYADYYGIAEYTMIGNHAFFYKWVTKPAATEPVTPTPDTPTDEPTDAPAETSQETSN